MALPNTIENGPGKWPDATKLQENFEYLYALIIGGGVIKQDTLANLKIYAALNPTVAFMCFDTGDNTLMAYTGNVTIGDNGFILVSGGI